ncbi:MAG TPA: HAMP domain-containing protein, partial [Casimicrobiaceae bacterium]|nr:HAMP domain-containing protein [Casimicrobiaceae bacterium]
MTLWPRSLFGRLALVLVGVLVLAVLATILLFSRDRTALIVRHFGETKLVQLHALRAALQALPADNPREELARLGREHGVRIFPSSEREPSGFGTNGWRRGTRMGERMGERMGDGPRMRDLRPRPDAPGDTFVDRDGDGQPDPQGPMSSFLPLIAGLESRFTEELGPGVEVRVQPRIQVMWVRLPAGSEAYWIAFPLPPRPATETEPTRALVWSLALLAALLIAAFLFARYLARPLRDLEGAVARVGRGETPQPLPESGPSEIAAVNRGFNTMLANLRQIERDRTVLLAGVSHDLRTPLARLRLGVELAQADEPTREGMIADIEEMDRVIGQFLDFARGEDAVALESRDVNELIEPIVERTRRAGHDVRFVRGALPALRVRPTAIARLVGNLVDNALAYGAPPVEVTSGVADGHVEIDVADRGP